MKLASSQNARTIATTTTVTATSPNTDMRASFAVERRFPPRPFRRASTVAVVDEREKRMTQNEALFREVNERVQDHAEDGAVEAYDYFCECANLDCTFRVTLAPTEYEAIRADPKQFVVLPLHYTPEVESLVAENDAYWIVRKTGEAGEYVEHLDPRSR